MSLEDEIKEVLCHFDDSHSDTIIKILIQVKSRLKSSITQDYLQGKIQMILNTDEELERKKLCKNLKPYLDWYLQGL
jgi:hypothetical protein